MANIVFITDAFEYSGGGGGGDIDPGGELGTVEWLTPVLYETEGLYTLSGAPYTQEPGIEGFILDRQTNQLVMPRSIDFYLYSNQVLYTITDLDGDVLATNFSGNALGSFTMSVSGPWRYWRKGSSRRLLLQSRDRDRGSNPIAVASVDLDSGQLHTGLTDAQITSGLGLPAGVGYTGPQIFASSDGADVFLALDPSGNFPYAQRRIAKVQLDEADQFAGLSWLSGMPDPVGNLGVLGAAGDSIYTVEARDFGYLTSAIQRRSISSGEVITTIAPPQGDAWNMAYNSGYTLFTSTAMYVFFGTGPGATNQTTASDGTTFTGLQVHKISLSTNQVVGTWDLSSPPQLPASFNSYDPSGNNISAAGFDNSGNLWIGYGNDNDDPPTSIPGGVRYTVRIQRANLT